MTLSTARVLTCGGGVCGRGYAESYSVAQARNLRVPTSVGEGRGGVCGRGGKRALAGRQPTRVEQLAVRGSLSGGEGGRRTFASSSCETCGMPVGGARHDGLGVMMRTVLLAVADIRGARGRPNPLPYLQRAWVTCVLCCGATHGVRRALECRHCGPSGLRPGRWLCPPALRARGACT